MNDVNVDALQFCMAVPIIHINISGSLIAIYAAILATVTGIAQLIGFYRDRAMVKLTVRKNMTALGMRQYEGMKISIVTATNIGRRPLTITGFAMHSLYQKEEISFQWVLFDVRPPLPCEITEGKVVSAFVDEAALHQRVAYWSAWDTTGRVYRLNIAPWYKRWISSWKRKRSQSKAADSSLSAGTN